MINEVKPLAMDRFALLADARGARLAGQFAGHKLHVWKLPLDVVRRVESSAGDFATWLVRQASSEDDDRISQRLLDVLILRFPTQVVFEIVEIGRRSVLAEETWPKEFHDLRRSCWFDEARKARVTWVSYPVDIAPMRMQLAATG
jgi:hypothetical protein